MSLCRQCQRDPDEYDRFLRKQGDQLTALRAELAEAKARVAAIEETLAAIRGDAPRKDIATPEGEMRPTNTGVVAERA